MVEMHDPKRGTAVFPGSFDPVTRGHIDLIERASRLFPVLHVAVAVHPEKVSLFSVEERLALLSHETAAIAQGGRIEVESFDGLAVDFARRRGARWLVRGLRAADDAAFELPMALSNRRLADVEVDTIFLPASCETSFIRASLVRDIAARGGRLQPFVTPRVEDALRRKYGG